MKRPPKSLYLDTNIIYGWFERNVKTFKREKMPKIRSTDVMNWLYKSKISLFVSSLVKAEIFRFLKSGHGIGARISKRMWRKFERTYNVREIKLPRFELNIDDFIDIASKVSLGKKTFINITHIQIAKSFNLPFLTGDTKLNRIEFYFNKIIDYPSLRKLHERGSPDV